MDQVVGEQIHPAGYSSLYTETLTESLSENKVNNKKYLPKAEEYTEEHFGCKDLSSRCISLVPSGKDNDSHHIRLAKNIVFTADPNFFDSIDKESWKNMADSLKFSGIDSLEKASAMDLRVCPPCPVFHTWAALHGTSIFNGLNNPRHLTGINYIQTILQEGTDLSKDDIPLLIVFSDMNLTKTQIDQMKAEFKYHENILCISMETDLQLGFLVQLEKYASSMCLQFMDSIRVIVSQNITETIRFCIDKAESENKTKLANRLQKLGANHLFYSDIDNQWLSKPPYILASHGTFTQPKMSMTLPLIYIDKDVVEQLSETNKIRLERHRSFFSEMPYLNKRTSKKYSRDNAIKLFDYILSGEADSNYEYLSKQIIHISPHYDYLLESDRGVSWDGENSCFFVAEHSKDVFLRGALKKPCIIDLHEKPVSGRTDDSYNPDPYYREAHSLVGMQLLKYYYHGHDDTWRRS
ncbi:hypothetical protein [Endozoicomonas sp. SESOKO2]|uniref:hypothetical protein n=1 Tax=Endozoicomonas sp. SESOKO2 TaxID=2828743 RepID=UPI0021496FC1|nr:hypothetical protein [Endozoicomonas sp. SESOKO2]